MGRWRPAAPHSTPYITPSGYEILQAELKSAWLRRRDVVSALSAAAAEGDRSENAEYIYRKKELAGLDRRIGYLQKRLPILKVVREIPAGDAAYFGAYLSLSDEDGEQHKYRIVGPDETDASAGAISLDSPLARALLGKHVGDIVTVRVAGDSREFTIVSIRYETPQ